MTRRLLAAALLICPIALAESKTYAVRSGGKSTAQFHAEDTYDSFNGKTNRVSGSIVADAAAATTSSVTLSVDLGALDTGVGLRNKEMRERYLETHKFPQGSFKSVSVAGPATIAPNSPVEIKVTGDFTLHGVTKRMTIPVRVVVIPDGDQIHATSTFNVKMPEFGIHVPKNVLVTVNDEVPVRLDVWATAVK
jgi:polyisoprenoid-binding protein YceI